MSKSEGCWEPTFQKYLRQTNTLVLPKNLELLGNLPALGSFLPQFYEVINELHVSKKGEYAYKISEFGRVVDFLKKA